MPYREPEHHERQPTLPSYGEGPIPWEDPELPWPRRLLGTLSAGFLPIETARAAADGSVRPALVFALLSALPWAPVWAIVPFTHTLQFKANFALDVVSKPGLTLATDLAQSMTIGLLLSLVSFLTWSVPFASLLKAFAPENERSAAPRAAYRTALYRVWLVPFGMSLFWFAVWALPEGSPALAGDVIFLCFQLLPRMLIVLHCNAMARYFGASPGGALIVSGVPLAVEWAAGLWVWHVTQGFLPEPPPGDAAGAG